MSSISKKIFERVKKLADKGASCVTQIRMLHRKRISQRLKGGNVVLVILFNCCKNMYGWKRVVKISVGLFK